MTNTLLTHEELISKAFAAYENSSLDYGLSISEMLEKLNKMVDAGLWGFIAYCETNKK